MPNRTRTPKKRPRDFNARAFQSVAELTGTVPPEPQEELDPIRAAARELGRRGGVKGGKARSEKLTPKERTDIARIAAAARWKKRDA